MGDYYFDKDQGRSTGSGAGTNAGVTVTISASTGYKWLPVGIQCSGDAAALVTVESPASTVIYRKRFAAAFSLSENFLEGCKVGANDGAILVKISASTSNCEANIDAFKIRN